MLALVGVSQGVTFKASLEQVRCCATPRCRSRHRHTVVVSWSRVMQRLRREYDKPRVRELEFVLQEPFTDARVRRVADVRCVAASHDGRPWRHRRLAPSFSSLRVTTCGSTRGSSTLRLLGRLLTTRR